MGGADRMATLARFSLARFADRSQRRLSLARAQLLLGPFEVVMSMLLILSESLLPLVSRTATPRATSRVSDHPAAGPPPATSNLGLVRPGGSRSALRAASPVIDHEGQQSAKSWQTRNGRS